LKSNVIIRVAWINYWNVMNATNLNWTSCVLVSSFHVYRYVRGIISWYSHSSELNVAGTGTSVSWNYKSYLRVGVLTVLAVNITVFWDVTCYLVEVTQTFGVTYCLHLCTRRLIWFNIFLPWKCRFKFIWNTYKFELAGMTCARRW
jgi:hypothetical protein